MKKRKINIAFCFLLTVFLSETKAQSSQIKKLSDASIDPVSNHSGAANPADYTTVVQQWKTVYDVNTWIKENFRYDFTRAKQLAENSAEREKTGIFSPAELYRVKKGVCIDLCRFAVETINIIDTAKHVQYLMIEFEPVLIDSSIIKKHWLAVYHDSSGYYLLADSKRPGYIAGPYIQVADFIAEYQSFRERKIVSWKVLMSYQKKQKQKAVKQDRYNLN
jgi:hypothetical protein